MKSIDSLNLAQCKKVKDGVEDRIKKVFRVLHKGDVYCYLSPNELGPQVRTAIVGENSLDDKMNQLLNNIYVDSQEADAAKIHKEVETHLLIIRDKHNKNEEEYEYIHNLGNQLIYDPMAGSVRLSIANQYTAGSIYFRTEGSILSIIMQAINNDKLIAYLTYRYKPVDLVL